MFGWIQTSKRGYTSSYQVNKYPLFSVLIAWHLRHFLMIIFTTLTCVISVSVTSPSKPDGKQKNLIASNQTVFTSKYLFKRKINLRKPNKARKAQAVNRNVFQIGNFKRLLLKRPTISKVVLKGWFSIFLTNQECH